MVSISPESTTLARQSSPPQRIRFLDGWRGAAIGAVLLGHFVPIPGSDLGRMGVELFFVLSGRLMAQILIEQRPALSVFYWRRFSRVVPALAVFVLAVFGLSHLFSSISPSGREYVSVLTFWSNYLFAFTGREPVFGHTWSLAIEEHSYLLLGVIAIVVSRDRALAFCAAVALALLCWARAYALDVSGGLDYYQVYWRTDVRAASILTGFSIYLARPWILALLPEPSVRAIDRTFVAMILVGTLLFTDLFPDIVKYTLGPILFALAMVLGEDTTERRGTGLTRAVCHPALVWLGTVSYSTYLYQQVFHVLKTDFTPFLYPAWILPSLLAGYLSYRLIEQPTRRALNGLLSHR